MTLLASKISYSRIKARKKVKQMKKYKDLPTEMIVHHIDGNPFNNDMANLVILEVGEHTSIHAQLYDSKPGRPSKTIGQLFKELEEALILYNFDLMVL